MRGHESVVAPRQRSASEVAKEQEEISNTTGKIQGLLGQKMLTQMHEPFKSMRVIFQIKEIRANLPQGVLSVDLGADFQIKPCDARAMLQKQITDRRLKRMEHTYPGKMHKFNEVLPPDLRRQIKFKQEYLADEEYRQKVELQRADKLTDDSTVRHESDICTFSNLECLQIFDEEDDEGNPTAFKDVVRLFREPESRRFLPKQAYLRLNVVEADEQADEEISYGFGDTQKIDLAKYVGLFNEPVSFMFRPTQAQLAEKPTLPAIVKLDAEITVRGTDSPLTSDPQFDDLEEAKREEAEVEKQHTLAVVNFKGPDPVMEAAKEFPELEKITNRDILLDHLEHNTEIRKKICAKHLIVRYVLDGMGFVFPEDEQLHMQDPEGGQVWNQFEVEFEHATDRVETQDQAIDAAFAQNAADVKYIYQLEEDLKALEPPKKEKANQMSEIDQAFQNFVF